MSQLILAVDDEANVTRLEQVLLQRSGYRVVTAADGMQALARLEEERPDLILADITMPHLDGIELLRRLKANPETASIPVILVTAKAQDGDIFEGERAGAALYLSKPFSPMQLLEAVQRTLAEHSSATGPSGGQE